MWKTGTYSQQAVAECCIHSNMCGCLLLLGIAQRYRVLHNLVVSSSDHIQSAIRAVILILWLQFSTRAEAIGIKELDSLLTSCNDGGMCKYPDWVSNCPSAIEDTRRGISSRYDGRCTNNGNSRYGRVLLASSVLGSTSFTY